MSMMCPPHRVKIVSTPSFLRALATMCPPEMTSASRVFRLSVSSAVVVARLSVVLVAVSSMDASIRSERTRRGAGAPRGRSSGGSPEERRPQASAGRQLRRCTNRAGPIRVRAAQGFQDRTGHQRRQAIERGGRDEYPVPVYFRGDL